MGEDIREKWDKVGGDEGEEEVVIRGVGGEGKRR
jgi:hypothetical protein